MVRQGSSVVSDGGGGGGGGAGHGRAKTFNYRSELRDTFDEIDPDHNLDRHGLLFLLLLADAPPAANKIITLWRGAAARAGEKDTPALWPRQHPAVVDSKLTGGGERQQQERGLWDAAQILAHLKLVSGVYW
ncbi:hypothetical protein MY10362_006480 [Beauveria mimosiformis]